MDREKFLREEHARIVSSGEFVASEWRDSVDQFIADIWDMTSFTKAGRFLATRDATLGFSPDNVECHFHGPTRPTVSSKPKKVKKRSAKITAMNAECRAVEAAARFKRRKKLVEAVLAWELSRKIC